jgi:sec-independent protein translocase protein TatB
VTDPGRVFEHFSLGDLLVLGALGLVLFGPDRLPRMAADAARVVRQLRAMAQSATSELHEHVPELGNLDLSGLRRPRRFLADQLLGSDPDISAPAAPARPSTGPPLAAGELPPLDPDTT